MTQNEFECIKLVIIPINSIIRKNIKRYWLDNEKRNFNIISFTFYISLILLGFVSNYLLSNEIHVPSILFSPIRNQVELNIHFCSFLLDTVFHILSSLTPECVSSFFCNTLS